MGKKYTVRCKELLSDGTGLVNFNGSNFNVAGVLPGEKINIELVYGKDKTGARLAEVIEPSKDRIEVKCGSFERCGGCAMLHTSYENEIRFKQEKVNKLFDGVEATMFPIIRADKPLHYRNKVYASVSFKKTPRGNKIVAGLYEENSHKVVSENNCLIQNEKANEIIKFITDLCTKMGIRSYDVDTRTGVLRHIYIRVSESTGKVMVVLVTGSTEFPGRQRFVNELTKKFPEIETVIHNINGKKTSMVLGTKEQVVYGEGYITDSLLGKKFKISSGSFFQVNPKQTEKLYKSALDLAGIDKNDTVLDAYCGTGTIALLAADYAKRVVGVEVNGDAVRDAVANAKANGVDNVEFVKGDASENWPKERIDVVIMDPPRAGSTEKFLNAAASAKVPKIVYISCNPETQVRDVAFLETKGYEVELIQPVDMFPRTVEIENIVLMTRR